MIQSNSKTISLIIPTYNEELNLKSLFSSLENLSSQLSELGIALQAIVIDNTSTDSTWELLKQYLKTEPKFEIVISQHPVNLGMQQSLLTGLKLATGNAIGVMQSDLQDPPEIILEMVKRWNKGEIFVATKIEKREGSAIPRIGAWFFYRILASISDGPILPDSSDFYLFDSKFQKTLINKSGSTPFLRASLASISPPSSVISYTRLDRENGNTNFNLKRRVNFAFDAMLRDLSGLVKKAVVLASIIGISALLVLLTLGLSFTFGYQPEVSGWFSTMSVLLIILSTTMFIGAIALELLSRIHRDIPRYNPSIESETFTWEPKG